MWLSVLMRLMKIHYLATRYYLPRIFLLAFYSMHCRFIMRVCYRAYMWFTLIKVVLRISLLDTDLGRRLLDCISSLKMYYFFMEQQWLRWLSLEINGRPWHLCISLIGLRHMILSKEELDLLIFNLLQSRQEKTSLAIITWENLKNYCNWSLAAYNRQTGWNLCKQYLQSLDPEVWSSPIMYRFVVCGADKLLKLLHWTVPDFH